MDYSDYNDFVHFSSAQERLLNFKYKLDLVNDYSQSIASASLATTGLQGASGSKSYYENLLTGVISNFDHYERFLYYESGSTSWPKSNVTKPYVNKLSNATEAIIWYSNQVANAIDYDNTNYSSLAYSIPTYLRDDANNENYLTFVYMVGQHFDNLWLYSKAVTDKYDADNRIDKGISKDLVAEALKNFGVKLYTSNKSVEDLFTTFIGQGYASGSETIVNYITGSLTGSNTPIQPTSYDNYQKEIQKRIYHNLPLLLKSKGTERGLRALINCLGVPGDILEIKVYGGRNTNERPFYGDYQYYTSSLDKVRLDHTGSIISGSTLSNHVSIIKRDNKYTDDLHAIEVGFSPTDNVDNYIISKSLADTNLVTFNIDNYIGNPSSLTLPNYEGLYTVAEDILGDLTQYDIRDYVKLIKFFDNTVFKMVKDFIPARAVADTGIIIKPNLLNRSKAKSVKTSVDTISGSNINNAFNYTSSIDTAFTEGTDGSSFGALNEYTASYLQTVLTPNGFKILSTKGKGEARYDGEFANSRIRVTTGELNSSNTLKKGIPPKVQFSVKFFSVPPNALCTLDNTAVVNKVVQPGVPYSLGTLFGTVGIPAPPNTLYYQGTTSAPTSLIPSTYTFTNGQYTPITIYADAGDISNTPCNETMVFTVVTCSLGVTKAPSYIVQGATYDLRDWFTLNSNLDVSFEIKKAGTLIDTVTAPLYTYTFSGFPNDVFTVKVIDNVDPTCNQSVNVEFFTCYIQPNEYTVFEVFGDQPQSIVLVNVLPYFTGILPEALYYSQPYIVPNHQTAAAPNPTAWSLTPPDEVYVTGTGAYVKVVNVPNICERVIIISKISEGAEEYKTTTLRKGTNPMRACNVGDGSGYVTGGTAPILYTPQDVQYSSWTNQSYLNFQELWASNKRVTLVTTGLGITGWYSDGFRVYPYSNGYPNNTSLATYNTSEGVGATDPIFCTSL